MSEYFSPHVCRMGYFDCLQCGLTITIACHQYLACSRCGSAYMANGDDRARLHRVGHYDEHDRLAIAVLP